MSNRKLILYISCSLDGYIAKPNDDLSFLSLVQQEGEDYGYNDFIKTIDTVIVGRRTYDWIIDQGYDFPHLDKECYVITRQERASKGSLNFYNADLEVLITELKSKKGKNIFCDGGSQILNQILELRQFDEMVISIVPILLGSGKRLFAEGIPEQGLKLVSSRQFESGLLQAHYRVTDMLP
ncbi:dihydrofolate reductase family protein [Winogradskyella sp.]|uniref:dihydrofolate reductase family protein n=1 Tax=Winogradskyella sp. TaxID=1883156 RepID=UPI003BA8E31A